MTTALRLGELVKFSCTYYLKQAVIFFYLLRRPKIQDFSSQIIHKRIVILFDVGRSKSK
jgi:hypothetical protein